MAKIKITHNDLKQIIKESVKRVVNEEVGSTCQALQQALSIIGGVKESGLIAFTSPNPSSTEVELTKNLKAAEMYLQKALMACQNLGYR